MDICGEGRHPTIHDVVKLAEKISLRKSDAIDIIDHTATVAGTLAREMRNFEITRKTGQEISRAVDANRDRLASCN